MPLGRQNLIMIIIGWDRNAPAADYLSVTSENVNPNHCFIKVRPVGLYNIKVNMFLVFQVFQALQGMMTEFWTPDWQESLECLVTV